MSQILAGLDGVLYHIDDVLVFGSTRVEHDTRLEAPLSCLFAAGDTLKVEKCKIRMSFIQFLGHVIDQQGIQPDTR